MALRISFTRISPTLHRVTIRRADGTGEQVDLDTKSFLLHDLVHLAVESEAGLMQSFWGRLARGASYAEFADPTAAAAYGGELLATERVVGALQGALAHGFDAAAFHARFCEYLRSLEEEPPAWLTVPMLQRVQERLRQLQGHWRATPFGAAMEIRFAPP